MKLAGFWKLSPSLPVLALSERPRQRQVAREGVGGRRIRDEEASVGPI
jgi:hypothetical protein